MKVNRFVMAKGEEGDEKANLSVKGLRDYGGMVAARGKAEPGVPGV